MKSMVVLFAVVAAACGSLLPAQPPHHPALVLDPHGRPLDTAEVINARALHLQAKHLEGHHYAPLAVAHATPLAVAHAAPLAVAHHAPLAYAHAAPAVYAAPHTAWVGGSSVSHQSRVDVHSSPAVVAHAAPLLAHSALGHGHWLHKRSLGHLAYAAPLAYAAAPHTSWIGGSAVSHQSRVDVHSSPVVVSHAVATPVVAHAVAAPVVAHVAPAAVSHQSRVDVRTSPAVVAHSVVAAPVVAAHSWAAPLHSTWSSYGAHGAHGLAHYLKKRSLALAHILPAAVSHQSRVDVISSHAPVVAHAAPVALAHSAPVVVAHAAPAVSHQSRVDYISTPAHIAPLAHSAVWTAPAAHWSHSPLALAAHW